MYWLPRLDTCGNLPVRSENIISLTSNACVYKRSSTESSMQSSLSSSSMPALLSEVDMNRRRGGTGRFVECWPCRFWSRCPFAVATEFGVLAANMCASMPG